LLISVHNKISVCGIEKERKTGSEDKSIHWKAFITEIIIQQNSKIDEVRYIQKVNHQRIKTIWPAVAAWSNSGVPLWVHFKLIG
jgi:hypothetical protein